MGKIQREAILSIAIPAIGMAFYWPFFRNNYFGLLFSKEALLSNYHANYYLLLLVLVVVYILPTTIWYSRVERVIRQQRILVTILSCVGSLGALLCIIISIYTIAPVFILTCSVIMLSLSLMSLTLMWADFISSIDSQRAVVILTLSLLLSYPISLSALLPHPFLYVLPVAACACSGLAWLSCRYPKVKTQKFTAQILKSVWFRTILYLIFFLVVGSFVRGFFSLGVLDFSVSRVSTLRFYLSLTFSLILMLVVLHRQKNILLFLFWAAVFLTTFAGLFSAAAFYSDHSLIGANIVIVSRDFISYFLWVVLIMAPQGERLPPIPLFGICFLLTQTISGFMSDYIVPYLIGVSGIMLSDYTVLFSLITAFVLLFGFLGYVISFLIDNKVVVPETNSMLSREEVCAETGRKDKLTARETEVLSLISRGYGLNKIAETLYISLSTAQTHAKSLYRKMGVHSRQEIIDLIDRELNS